MPGSGAALRFDTNLPTNRWRFLYPDPLEAWLAFRVQIGRHPAVLLVLAHLPSKLRAKDTDQLLAATKLNESVRAIERQQGHERTLAGGDLNVNPFESPLCWAGALNAVMSREVIDRLSGERTIRGEEYPFFYNPMWSVMGDRTPGPSGTYYRAASESANYFWSTSDQVLMRPALMHRLSELIVPVSDGEASLVTPNGSRPHHPIAGAVLRREPPRQSSGDATVGRVVLAGGTPASIMRSSSSSSFQARHSRDPPAGTVVG